MVTRRRNRCGYGARSDDQGVNGTRSSRQFDVLPAEPAVSDHLATGRSETPILLWVPDLKHIGAGMTAPFVVGVRRDQRRRMPWVLREGTPFSSRSPVRSHTRDEAWVSSKDSGEPFGFAVARPRSDR